MTSDIPFVLKFIHQYDELSLEHSIPYGTLPNRLLSPITETSAEILSISLPINKTTSNTSQKSPNLVLTNNTSTIDETLLQKFHQYTTNFHQIQNFLNTLDQHLQALSLIIKHLKNDKNLTDAIEPLETRLLQIRVKRDQIDRLLNQSSLQKIIQQISPLILKSKSVIDYHEFLTSIQLSMNQKTVLIDHLTNAYRYRKYQINEYSSKFQQQHNLLLQFIRQIKQYYTQHDQLIQQVNHISIYNEHNRQCTELNHLSNEYERLQTENHLLTLNAKEKLQRLSMLIQSKYH